MFVKVILCCMVSIIMSKKTVNEKLSEALDVKFKTDKETKEISKPPNTKEIEIKQK